MTNGVPCVLINGDAAYSDSTKPRDVADVCACWPRSSLDAKAADLARTIREVRMADVGVETGDGQ